MLHWFPRSDRQYKEKS